MDYASNLPSDLAKNVGNWQAGAFNDNRALYERLVAGQSPPALVISCCDSRVLPTEVFNAGAGDLFIHRNIANFVPSVGDSHVLATAAAVEHAVQNLAVQHIIVMGHSGCAGVAACYDGCSAKEQEGDSGADSFVGQWVALMRPAYDGLDGLDGLADRTARLVALEQAAVLLSLENLMTFDFVREKVVAGDLSLHGAWLDIKSGDLKIYNAGSKRFVAL
ncbi:MAG: carbonic anhydrase [Candidatus Halichondribacter symbioticus]